MNLTVRPAAELYPGLLPHCRQTAGPLAFSHCERVQKGNL